MSYYRVMETKFHALTLTVRPTKHILFFATHLIVPDMFRTNWCILTGSVFRRLLRIYIVWFCVR
jgi:hypothetical protein